MMNYQSWCCHLKSWCGWPLSELFLVFNFSFSVIGYWWIFMFQDDFSTSNMVSTSDVTSMSSEIFTVFLKASRFCLYFYIFQYFQNFHITICRCLTVISNISSSKIIIARNINLGVISLILQNLIGYVDFQATRGFWV